jgi:hypothetical protein
MNNNIREDVINEVVNRLEDVMDWYKSGGDGDWKGWSVEEDNEIMKRFLGKE